MNIGADKIHFQEGRLFVHAAEPMDWPIREFCRVPVYFQGQKYYVRSKRDGEKPWKVVYELWPWPVDLYQASSESILYDEAYVTERDGAAALQTRGERFHLFLLPFYPFLGLFWSGFKHGTLGAMGFEPGSITRISIALTFNLFILQAIFVGWLGSGMLILAFDEPGLRLVDWALLVLLGADSVIRYGQSLGHDVQRYWGFCEWLWPRR